MTTEERQGIADRMDRRMGELQVSRTDLARLVGGNYEQVQAWLEGRHVPRADSIVRICRVLKMSSDELLGLDTVCLPEPKYNDLNTRSIA